MVLKWPSFVGAFLFRKHVPHAFRGSAGFDVDTIHISQGVPEAIILVVSVASNRGARAHAVCEAGLFRSKVFSQFTQEEVVRVGLNLAVFHLSVCVSFSPPLRILPQRRGVLKQMGLMPLQRSDALPV